MSIDSLSKVLNIKPKSTDIIQNKEQCLRLHLKEHTNVYVNNHIFTC